LVSRVAVNVYGSPWQQNSSAPLAA
jgi:hypothetical protein